MRAQLRGSCQTTSEMKNRCPASRGAESAVKKKNFPERKNYFEKFSQLEKSKSMVFYRI
jgi:hypothetical protein